MPLPLTPGDQRENHAARAGAAVAALYEQAELVIIATIAALARKVATGAMLEQAAANRLRSTVTTVLSAAAPKIRLELDTAMQGASQQSRALISSTTPQNVTDLVGPGQWTEPLAQLLDTAGDNAADSAETALAAITGTIGDVAPPTPAPGASAPPISPFRTALTRSFGDSGGWPGSTLSARRIAAAQKMLDDLANQGITGFTDSAGRRWDLATYCEMATRTAVSNAWDDMQAQVAIRSGLDLVRTGTYSQEGSCPACIPWLGRTLSLTGATDAYPTVDEAKAAGWRHPNCRCFWTPIGAAVAIDVTNPVDLDDAAQVYKASQRQRALERRVRAAGRRAQSAITPQAKTRARRDLASARAVSAAHRQQHQLRMMQVSVHRRERPFGAR